VRKLLLTLTLICLVAVPAAYAATTAAPGDQSGDETLLASPLAKPLDASQAGRQLRAARADARRESRPAVPRIAIPPQLEAIAQCESGGNPRAINAGGTYRGKYQFSTATWAGVGGTGDPAAAPEAEQDRRAAMLYARSGAGQWPVCGR
jgi:transglycosylase-like protein